jgi:hypothetical protein
MSEERITVTIFLNGASLQIKFRIQEGVTVDWVENTVRSGCNVTGGCLSYSPDELDVVISLTAGDAYHFVGFRVRAQAGKDGL